MRTRTLLGFSVLAAVAAVAFAAAPVEQHTDTYEFRPGSASLNTNGEVSVASLPLVRRGADEIHLVMPCDVPGSSFSSTVRIGNRRAGSIGFFEFHDSLLVRVSDRSVTVGVGPSTLIDVDAKHESGCIAEVRYEAGFWHLTIDGETESAQGVPAQVSEARFSGPAAMSDESIVVVSTRELGTSPSMVQWALLGVALLTLGVAFDGLRRYGTRSTQERTTGESRTKRFVRGLRVVDVGVVATLGLWLLFIPANIDDGWIAATVASYDGQGDFSGVYTSYGSVFSFGYWVSWLQHIWFGFGDSYLIMRLPAFFLGVATWLVLRSIGRRFDIPGKGGSAWLMGAAFVVGSGAWGMTLRMEPVIAFLVASSMALAVRFHDGHRGLTMVMWSLVIALGLTTHPAGIVVIAPLIASWGSFREWLRSSDDAPRLALAWALSAGALLTLVWFVDSSVATKLDSIEISRQASSHDNSLADELLRYRNLDLTPYGTPMRRLSVALMALGVGGFLLRGRRGAGAVNLLGWSLVVGMLLLTLTPSKWPWHFGGLLALVALVLAVEARRVARSSWGFYVLGAAAAFSWVWSVSLRWSPFDLRTLQWTEFDPVAEVERSVVEAMPFELSSLVGWALMLGVVALVAAAVLRLRSDLGSPHPPEAVTIIGAILVVIVLASTLWSDTANTPAWTLGRQNLDAALGRSTCGLGDEIEIPVPGSLHALSAGGVSGPDADLAARAAGFSNRGGFVIDGIPPFVASDVPVDDMIAVGSWMSDAPVPEDNVGRFQSEWLSLDADDDAVVVFLMGAYTEGDAELGNAAGIQWGASGTDGEVADRGVERFVISGFFGDWQFATVGVPADVDRVRLLLRDDSARSREAWIAASLPFAIELDTVASVSSSEDVSILITPPLAPYFPCVAPLALQGSLVPTPDVIIQTWGMLWQTAWTGATAPYRWYGVEVDLDPPLPWALIGAHTGDTRDFLFVSQQYVTGVNDVFNGEFEMVE